MQLYTKQITGKRVRYIPYDPQAPTKDDYTNGEILTLSASLALMVMIQIESMHPDKSFIATRTRKIGDAVAAAMQGCGSKVKDEDVLHWMNVWNKTMMDIANSKRDEGETCLNSEKTFQR